MKKWKSRLSELVAVIFVIYMMSPTGAYGSSRTTQEAGFFGFSDQQMESLDGGAVGLGSGDWFVICVDVPYTWNNADTSGIAVPSTPTGICQSWGDVFGQLTAFQLEVWEWGFAQTYYPCDVTENFQNITPGFDSESAGDGDTWHQDSADYTVAVTDDHVHGADFTDWNAHADNPCPAHPYFPFLSYSLDQDLLAVKFAQQWEVYGYSGNYMCSTHFIDRHYEWVARWNDQTDFGDLQYWPSGTLPSGYGTTTPW